MGVLSGAQRPNTGKPAARVIFNPPVATFTGVKAAGEIKFNNTLFKPNTTKISSRQHVVDVKMMSETFGHSFLGASRIAAAR